VLVPTQYGFRANYSTIHAILNIITTYYTNIDKKSFQVLLLDLSKAFDTVNHNIFLSKLDHYGICGIPNEFFKSYLANKSQVVVFKNHQSSLGDITNGVP